MYSPYQPPFKANNESHVFRMTGNDKDVVRACKGTLAAAGFRQFTAFGKNFFCCRELDATSERLIIYVEVELVSHEQCEVTFRKFTGMLSAHQQLVQMKLDTVQEQLQSTAA